MRFLNKKVSQPPASSAALCRTTFVVFLCSTPATCTSPFSRTDAVDQAGQHRLTAALLGTRIKSNLRQPRTNGAYGEIYSQRGLFGPACGRRRAQSSSSPAPPPRMCEPVAAGVSAWRLGRKNWSGVYSFHPQPFLPHLTKLPLQAGSNPCLVYISISHYAHSMLSPSNCTLCVQSTEQT